MSIVLLRHAWAGHRAHWDDDDRLRPLDERGREQARRLARALQGARRLVSSPYVRCVQTLETFGLPVETDERLAEGATREDVLQLAAEVGDGAVLCTHGDITEAVLGRELNKGEYAVL
jgi:phosphohistidine phosphatase SixA